MGYKQSPALIVVALLLLTPLAYGLVPNTANVNGKICCTSTGNCPPGWPTPGIPGVRVSLNCTNPFGNVVRLDQSFTVSSGVFSFLLKNISAVLDPLINGILPCGVFVNLPLNSTVCPILDTAVGTLRGAPTIVGTAVDPEWVPLQMQLCH